MVSLACVFGRFRGAVDGIHGPTARPAVDSDMTTGNRPGRVCATPDRPPPRAAYDIVVLGGGLMGAATAALLRRWAPALDVVLIEAAGIPNEGGATVASPGLLPPISEDGGGVPVAALRWARSLVEAALPSEGGVRAGWLELAPGQGAAARPLDRLLTAPAVEAVRAMTGVAADRPAVLEAGGYLGGDALAYRFAREAVRSGADLMLNTRVRPRSGEELVLERLALDRRMTLEVRARHTVASRAVVVACGADGAEVAESALDRPVRLDTAFQQYPRVRLEPFPAGVTLPVVSLGNWRFRPAPGGARLVAPALPPDPVGYEPVGGRLLGVPVGLRRELVEALLDAPELEALLASGRLDLGKSVRAVRGARTSVPADGLPVARRVAERWWLLAGSGVGLLHDLAGVAGVVAEVAARVAGVSAPWPPTED